MNIYLLSDNYHEGVINLPQIEVTCKDVKVDLSSYDALIFSSKNGVKCISKINNKWIKIPSFAIGEPTAEYIKQYGGKVEYTAKSSYGNDFAKELIIKLKDKKVLFLRAEKVLSKLETILKDNGVDISSQIIYETTCKSQNIIKLKENAIIIFTSPSTVKCFLNHYKWKDTYQAVCIGTVTANYFPLDIPLHVSSTQTIDACIELSKTLIKQN